MKLNKLVEELADENLMETYKLLSELLNPDDSYEYVKVGKSIWRYQDIFDNYIFVRMVYQPTSEPYCEVKTWWLDENNKPVYNEIPKSSTAQDWNKRSNTIAKIFRDEIIPMFKTIPLTDKLVFYPVTASRYYFSIRMIKKFIPSEWEIIEESPKKITIIRK